MSQNAPRQETDTQESERGVSFTLDALFMGLFLLAGLLLAFSLAPNPSAQTEADLAEMRFESEIDDLVAIGQERGNTVDSVLYWEDSAGHWVGTGGEPDYTTLPSGHPLKSMTDALDERGLNYAVTVEYLDVNGNLQQDNLITQGAPGADAVVASQSFVIEDDTNLVGPYSGQTVSTSATYFAPDAFPESGNYNIVTFYVVVWRS